MTRIYFFAAAIAAISLLSGGGVWWIKNLQAENARLETAYAKAMRQFAACSVRVQTILRDKESDDEIDRIPDSDLNRVPLEWLRPGTP